MYGYGNGEDVVRIPKTSVWQLPQLLGSWAGEQQPMAVKGRCESPQELLQSESFDTFLRIFNTICARDAQRSELYGWKPTIGEEMLRDKFTRDRAFALWKNLQVQGKVDAIRDLDDQIQKWMVQLDEIEDKEKEVRTMRQRIGA